ncbi:radical SAM protein [Marseilla massiliensis]|nr:radical SAM protein [Marseilla massiliensis]MCL1611152.1 radical SAM protein [Marseilla massiliensis]
MVSVSVSMNGQKVKMIGIIRHRLSTDGDGVTTLAAFHGCPLRCRHCLNPQSLGGGDGFREYTPDELYAETSIDNLYFLATHGGVTFGGGEPCLYPKFICDFRKLCGPAWRINIETSLNVPGEWVKTLIPVVDTFIIDIKDMNPGIYQSYTGQANDLVAANLRLIVGAGRQGDCIVRIPLIPGYNNDADRAASRSALEELGFSRFDLFTYKIKSNDHGTGKTNMQDTERDSSADS